MNWMDILKVEYTTYVVKDEIWNQAGGEGMDDIVDLERKLNRKLQFDDFSEDPANWSEPILEETKTRYPKIYEILMDRIGGDEGRKKLAEKYMDREIWTEGRQKGKTQYHIDYAKKLLGME